MFKGINQALVPIKMEETGKWLPDLHYCCRGINDDKQKLALLLLHYAGEKVREIFDSLPETETGEDFVAAVNALNIYFQLKQNKYERHHIFHCCSQEEAESIDSYVTHLRTLARTCEFHSGSIPWKSGHEGLKKNLCD